MKKKRIGSTLFLTLVLLFLYLPIVVVIVYSFNDNPARIPLQFTGWTTRWYEELFAGKGGYGSALVLSLQVALWSVLSSVVIGTLGAVGMVQATLRSGKGSRGDNLMESIAILPIMIPEIILGLAFMVIFDALGIKGNTIRLVLAHTTFCIPYVFLSVKSRMVSMDTALFDAARDLGATQRRILRDITLPLCAPAILSGAFLAFAMSMDDFVISFFVYGVGEGTLPLKIYSSVKTGVSLRVNALCTLMILAVFLLVAMNQYLQAVRAKKERMLQKA
ncbi:MAG: ABC transporter permease [Clostridia bacterium]|nr:ABC transporter permease [Clostridia bacterium]